MALGNELAIYLKGLINADNVINVVSGVTATTPDDLRITPLPTVSTCLCFPAEATVEKAGRGCVLESNTVGLLLSRKMDLDAGALDRDNMIGILRLIDELCRYKTKTEDGVDWVWTANDIPVLWDQETWEKGTYSGLLKVTFEAMTA